MWFDEHKEEKLGMRMGEKVMQQKKLKKRF